MAWLRVTRILCRVSRGYSSSPVELTSSQYPSLKRLDHFKKLDDKDVNAFTLIVGPNNVCTDASELLQHNTDWIKTVRGSSSLMLKPGNVDELSAVVKYCNKKVLAICPQSGNTGLVGGSNPVFDEVIVNMSRMNKSMELDQLSGILVADAGCVLQSADEYLQERGFTMPLDLGAKGSCLLGGNVSTNAGGIRLLRYGSLLGTVLGLEVVLSDGRILNTLSTIRKDNTGFHLRQLFVGSEGTLGIVSKVAILCPPKFDSINVAFLGLKDFDSVLRLVTVARKYLAEILSALEIIDYEALTSVEKNLKLTIPIDATKFKFFILIETSGSNSDHDIAKLNAFLEKAMGDDIIKDGIVVSEPSKVAQLWAIRERITESLTHDGYMYKYDLSLPLPKLYSVVEVIRERTKHLAIRTAGYGHLGDGNIHLNVMSENKNSELSKLLEPYVYEYTSQNGGSVSAEHGIGFVKRPYLHLSKNNTAIEVMKQIKNDLDPKCILNPYKIFM